MTDSTYDQNDQNDLNDQNGQIDQNDQDNETTSSDKPGRGRTNPHTERAGHAGHARVSPSNVHDLPRQVPSITNSPRCAPSQTSQTRRPTPPQQASKPGTPRRVRTVRVDAWADPASANWSRQRTSVRKVNGRIRSTDWALPF